MLYTCISSDLQNVFFLVGQFGTGPALANPTLAQNVQHPITWLGGWPMLGSWPPYPSWLMNLGWPPNVAITGSCAFPQMPLGYPQVPWPTNVVIIINVQTQSFPTM
jgi:hypothetical protein